jgi:3-oxoacyl-[acyl-carrier-protein] synthase II
VYIGSGLGCITSAFDNYIAHLLGRLEPGLLSRGRHQGEFSFAAELEANIAEHPRVLPVASTKSMANSLSARLSIRYGLQGPNETCIAACAAGTTAIARAHEQVTNGRVDFALAGGSEFYGDRAGGIFMAFDRLNTLAKARDEDEKVNRPFDLARTGFLFSQGGACVLALESMESARARGATILATVKGSYSNSDAYSLAALSPNGSAIRRMIQDTLSHAGVSSNEIDYVNAHGTGTTQNDDLEAAIIESEFPHGPFVNSTKSLLGHTIGACGAIEAAVAVLGITGNELHPTINLTSPVRDLNFVLKRTSAEIHNAFSHNFGFGGHNVGLVLGRD